ncbi:hypothetical protein [Mycobacterium sp. 1274756.6]|uniref:hypothetical protein n=1 Tax=Mycobacterium sp. 1274756.6 TaxID=1834076 RepID=UPI000800CF10|nr:hypothetical protein [Mycobacterium sp. 1274756.6]OBJ71427.1 hypothetical protein A5643_07685 [Mycobacterium sp. 1274756.6]
MSACPPVTHLVLYKLGVAFVVHRGPVDGDVALTVRRTDMPDVLKSLVVSAAGADAAVGAITFDTPVDPPDDAPGFPVPSDTGTALRDLLDGLRGRSVEAQHGAATYRGEVIGVDEPGAGQRTLLLRTDAGQVEIVDLAGVGRLSVLDPGARAELARLLDRAKAATAGPHATIGVNLRGRAAEAELSYLVAAPMWRVSYRLIRDGDRATLAAMGILHNPVDEDLTDIAVTLTTGQPHSFDIDLYHPRRVRRTVAEEQQRLVADRAMRSAPRDEMMLSGVPDLDSYGAAAEDVEAADSGEYFEYRLTTPVSLAPGGATMVPLAVAPVGQLRRELVWPIDSAPAPEITISFANDTDLVLEEGPAVIYEHGGYAGEAMLGFTARGARARLSFAKDLAVHCSSHTATDTVTVGVRLADTAAIEEQRVEQRHGLWLRNDHPDPVEVIVELPRRFDHHVIGDDTAVLLEDTDPDRHRLAVTVPGHRSVAATVLETWPVYRDVGYGDLSPARLDAWLSSRSLDAATIEELSEVLAERRRAEHLDAERDRLDTDRADLHAAASRITEQLQVLRTDGAEGQLRARQVGALAELQDQVAGLDAEIRRVGAEAAAARAAAAAQLQRLLS